MLKDLASKSLEDFTDVLASKSPVPGGGGAAALVGALGVALCSMVGNYTTGKKTYAAVEDDVQRMLAEAKSVRLRLLELVREDAEAFFPLSKAYAIPRDDPRRAKTLEEATKGACHAPLEMMRQICGAIELLEEMGQKGSRMLLSDVGCGLYLCRAALEAASLNVFVNTKTLADREFAQTAEAEADQMLSTYVPRAEKSAAIVYGRIREVD
jgi:formiminotetrahydrofolate cyclodeaminase